MKRNTALPLRFFTLALVAAVPACGFFFPNKGAVTVTIRPSQPTGSLRTQVIPSNTRLVVVTIEDVTLSGGFATTQLATASPTALPTASPTTLPTVLPTALPTALPTELPSFASGLALLEATFTLAEGEPIPSSRVVRFADVPIGSKVAKATAYSDLERRNAVARGSQSFVVKGGQTVRVTVEMSPVSLGGIARVTVTDATKAVTLTPADGSFSMTLPAGALADIIARVGPVEVAAQLTTLANLTATEQTALNSTAKALMAILQLDFTPLSGSLTTADLRALQTINPTDLLINNLSGSTCSALNATLLRIQGSGATVVTSNIRVNAGPPRTLSGNASITYSSLHDVFAFDCVLAASPSPSPSPTVQPSPTPTPTPPSAPTGVTGASGTAGGASGGQQTAGGGGAGL